VLLHAGAVAFNRRVIAFAAPGGVGKSTLTAALVRVGGEFLTDDVLPVRLRSDGVLALPGVGRMRLKADSISALGGSIKDYSDAASWANKLRVRIDATWAEVADEPLPLDTVYLLTPHLDTTVPVTIERCEPLSTAALRLLSNVYMAESLRGSRAVRALEVACAIVDRVRVKCVSYCRSYDQLQAVAVALSDATANSHD
jgi:hypothetical protein